MLRIVIIVAQLGSVFVRRQQCSSIHTCHYENTKAVSPLFLEFRRPKSAYTSCLWYCTRDPSCRAVTHDPTVDICRFHYEADDINCLEMVPASGKLLWVIPDCDPKGDRCCKVGLIILPLRVRGPRGWFVYMRKMKLAQLLLLLNHTYNILIVSSVRQARINIQPWFRPVLSSWRSGKIILMYSHASGKYLQWINIL